MPQKPRTRGGTAVAEVLIEVHGQTLKLKKANRRRLWSKADREALVGGRVEDYIAFFKSKGFEPELVTAPAIEPEIPHTNGTDRSVKQKRMEELRIEWQKKRESGELPPGVGVSEYRQSILEREGLT